MRLQQGVHVVRRAVPRRRHLLGPGTAARQRVASLREDASLGQRRRDLPQPTTDLRARPGRATCNVFMHAQVLHQSNIFNLLCARVSPAADRGRVDEAAQQQVAVRVEPLLQRRGAGLQQWRGLAHPAELLMRRALGQVPRAHRHKGWRRGGRRRSYGLLLLLLLRRL